MAEGDTHRHSAASHRGSPAKRIGPLFVQSLVARGGAGGGRAAALRGAGAAAEVRVNGEPVQKARPLRFSDEIQVRVPRPEGARAVRYTFERYAGPPAGRDI